MAGIDVRNPSVWIATSSATPYQPLSGSLEVDVVVVGGGITGITTALLAQREGASVAVLEAGRVAAGTTGFTTGKVTSLHGLTYADLIARHGHDKALQYAGANEAAIAQVAELVAELGIGCDWERRAAYTYTTAPEQASQIEREVQAATGLGLPASMVTSSPLPFEIAAAVRFDDQAQMHARRYVLGLADALVGAGGQVFEDTRAVGVAEGPQKVRVRTPQGDVTADAAVIATLLPFSDWGGFFARSHPTRSYALAARIDGEVPDGMFLSVDQPTRSVRPVHLDGEVGLVVGGGGHKTGSGQPQREYAELEAWTRQTFAVRSIDYRWSAQDYVPVDGVPYVGRSPWRRRTYVATGFKKWGMTGGTAAAMILRDLLAGRDNPWAPVFDATRIQPTISAAAGMARDNIAVAGQMVTGHLDRLTAGPATRLGPGEGALVTVDGRHVAAHRDADGQLHAVSAVCTHMGCVVRWNPAETTWDCPCHGSRFATTGEPLEGPAVKPLDPVTLDDPPA